jgi:predicted transcriptional regulator
MKIVISFKIDDRIKEAIQGLAKKENRNLSNYIVTLLMNHLDEQGIDWHKAPGKKSKK